MAPVCRAFFKSAKILIEVDEGLFSTALYHVQQSAEKALKGYLCFKNTPIQKTHDLIKLVRECVKLDADFLYIMSDASDINPYSTTTRYPDDYYVFPSLDTARILIKKAENIYRFVEDKIFAIAPCF